MKRSFLSFLDFLTYCLTMLFAIDRLWKLVVVIHLFRRSTPPQPKIWPTVTLLQPITQGTNELIHSLRKRAAIEYPAHIQHLFICDSHDIESQNMVNNFLNDYTFLHAELILVETPGAKIASKIIKLQAALPKATGEILCFMDDDVAPRQNILRVLVPFLNQPDVGAAFGLPCYTNWRTSWSSLMSGLVNANMPLSFVALSYLIDPFRITGHIVVFHRAIFEKVGGLNGLEQHIDDDFELARRLRTHGLRSIQTPLVYDIDNALRSKESYDAQLKRWFVLPRQAMMPSLSARERYAAFISSCTLPIPGIVAFLAFLTRSRASLRSITACLGIFSIVYILCERLFLKGHTPLFRWPLLILGAVVTPLQIIISLLSNNEIEWRGQRMRIHRNGKMEVII
jgi:ceramide glucosyltransferase